MEDLYNKSGKFAFEVFPNATPTHHILKMIDEADEVICNPDDIVGYADCLIALFAATNKAGFCYQELIDIALSKLDINFNRQWVELPDGTHQHETSN